jgi:hypothetical protein
MTGVRPLSAAAVAVRLRRFWLGPAARSPTVRASDLGEVWREVAVQRVASTLVLLTPYDFGQGDPLAGDLGDYLARRVTRLSGGAVREVAWRYDEAAVRPVRRARSTELDVHAPGDPGLDEYDDVLRRLRKHLPDDTSEVARLALGQLGLAGVSRHRVWLAASDEAAERAVRTTAGAAYALHRAVRGVQKAEPLYRVVVDPSLRRLERL